MFELERYFPGAFSGLTPQEKASVVQSSNEAVLRQASCIGPEEYLRVAQELSAKCHYSAAELNAQCDLTAPMPEDLKGW